jgi:hypothetical protein
MNSDKIPGVPEGWELVHCLRIGEPGEIGLNQLGEPFAIGPNRTIKKVPIIRKIEKPARYRPFANAEEFRPHRDRWTMHPNEPDKRFRTGDYNNDGVWGGDRRFYGFKDLFESGALFDDGTPFGVRIDE